MPGHVRCSKEGRVARIVFDHPERRNAISVAMWRQIPEVAMQVAADEEVRVVILRGAGEKAFVAGADISEFGSQRSGAATEDYDAASARAFGALAKLRVPVIAQIYGSCIGGGVAMSLTADMRYASDDAVFAIPAARLGLGYHVGGIEALGDLVGYSAAKEIFFTARRYSAEEARQMGLVNRTAPAAELEALVWETAQRIAENAPLTLESVKRIVSELSREPDARDIDSATASIAACFASDDYREGIRAFLEKRRPDFRGR